MVPPNNESGAEDLVPRTADLTPEFEADVAYWHRADPKIAARLRRIVDEVLRSPTTGIGKPELLRGNWRGCWSRRLTKEHRVLYRVRDTTVEFISARFHYE